MQKGLKNTFLVFIIVFIYGCGDVTVDAHDNNISISNSGNANSLTQTETDTMPTTTVDNPAPVQKEQESNTTKTSQTNKYRVYDINAYKAAQLIVADVTDSPAGNVSHPNIPGVGGALNHVAIHIVQFEQKSDAIKLISNLKYQYELGNITIRHSYSPTSAKFGTDKTNEHAVIDTLAGVPDYYAIYFNCQPTDKGWFRRPFYEKSEEIKYGYYGGDTSYQIKYHVIGKNDFREFFDYYNDTANTLILLKKITDQFGLSGVIKY